MAAVPQAIELPAGQPADPNSLGPRLARAGIGLGAVVTAYWLYTLVAVSLIEPRADQPDGPEVVIDEQLRPADARIEEIKEFFRPGDWQLKNPKILESNQSLVLFQTYHNHGNGQLEVTPCTVIHRPAGAVSAEEQRRRSIILDAPDGAVLQFDRPLEFGRGELGKLVNGKLNGWITIRSDGSSPGPEDDLRVITQNIELSQQQIWTNSPVDFRLGASYGRGQQMSIQLLPSPDDNHSGMPGLSFGGLESFELRKVEQLHIEPMKKPAASAPGSAAERLVAPPGVPQPANNPGMSSDLPMEIACRGPFRFHMLRMAATFEDRVDVLRIHPNGPSDKLTCDVLTIYFGDRRETAPANPPAGGGAGAKPAAPTLLDLEPRRFEAVGEPAVITLPSQDVDGRGQRLEYDLQTGRISAAGDQPILLRRGTSEIEAVSVIAHQAAPGRLGEVVAQGPGRFRGQMDNRAQPIEATWNQQLLIRPINGLQVVSLTGGAALKFPQTAGLEGNEIHFWLSEVPQPGPAQATKLQLQRMGAMGHVRLESPQFTGITDQLDVQFEQAPAASATPGMASATPRDPLGAMLRPAEARPSSAAGPGPPDAPPPMPTQHFEISGNRVDARVILPPDADGPAAAPGASRSGSPELAEVTVEQNVRLVETQTAKPGERPLLLTGDRLRAMSPAQPYGTLLVVGQRAHCEARGLGLTSTNINLNRGTNRMWIDGPGQMDLPMDRDFEGHPLAHASRLEVTWASGMQFDGQKATFEQSVVAVGANAQVRTDTLEVVFHQMVRFDDAPSPAPPSQQPDLEKILCRGGVWVESQTFRDQELTSIERMNAVDLSINRLSGAVVANGPGWISRVMRGGDIRFSGLPGSTPIPGATPPPPPAADSANRLRCLFVKFQGPLTGNVHQRDFIFHDDVQAAYDTVDDWETRLDPGRPESLGLNGAAMTCNQLEVRQMPTPLEGRPAMEMEALGNAVVESPRRGFTALAMRITYSEVNGMLKLEGDGRVDARLVRQTAVGGALSETAAQRIFYWPASEFVRVDGARSLEVSQFPDRHEGKR